jgi:hypothetical protein
MPILLLPLKSGANGLNLIEANHVVMVEPLLNVGVEHQAINRVHRIGQTRETHVHRFLVEDTIEIEIANRAEKKSETKSSSLSSSSSSNKRQRNVSSSSSSSSSSNNNNNNSTEDHTRMRLSELKQLFGVQSGNTQDTEKKQTKKEEENVVIVLSESEDESEDDDDEEEEEVKTPILNLEKEKEIPRLPEQEQESLQLTAGDRLVALETELSLEQDIGLSPRERIGRIERAIQWSCQKSSPGLIARISSAETQVFYKCTEN